MRYTGHFSTSARTDLLGRMRSPVRNGALFHGESCSSEVQNPMVGSREAAGTPSRRCVHLEPRHRGGDLSVWPFINQEQLARVASRPPFTIHPPAAAQEEQP